MKLQIESLTADIFKMQETLALLKAEQCQTMDFKGNFFYVLREALKLTQNKANALNKALARIGDQEDLDQIQDCLKVAGISIK